MKILNIIDEDIVNYKKISMYIAFSKCSFKCNIDCGKNICQNFDLRDSKLITVDKDYIINRYLSNPITHAIVIGGLEPFDSYFDLVPFIYSLRNKYNCSDDVVIYTGYTEDELEGKTLYDYKNACNQDILIQSYNELKSLGNIVVKFGRYKEGDDPHYDEVLGVNLASDNQYAKII